VLCLDLTVQQDLLRQAPRLRGPALRRLAWQGLAWRTGCSAVLLLLAGCGSSRPSFLDAIRHNCEQGSAEACALYASVLPEPEQDADIAPPLHSREIVQAILAGMRQANLRAERTYPQQSSPLVEDPKKAR
jgi:hypothetical protein